MQAGFFSQFDETTNQKYHWWSDTNLSYYFNGLCNHGSTHSIHYGLTSRTEVGTSCPEKSKRPGKIDSCLIYTHDDGWHVSHHAHAALEINLEN